MWQLVFQVLFVSKVLWMGSIHRKLCFLKLLLIGDFSTISEFSVTFVFMKISAWHRPVNGILHQKSNVKKEMLRKCDVTAWLPLIYFFLSILMMYPAVSILKSRWKSVWTEVTKIKRQQFRGLILTLCMTSFKET